MLRDSESSSSNLITNNHSMLQLEFKYPLSKEQLCDEPSDVGRFYVKARKFVSNWAEDQLLKELEIIGENLCGSAVSSGGGGHHNNLKWSRIMDNDNFDTIYSILFYLETTPTSARKELIENLNKGVKQLLKSIEKSHILFDLEKAAHSNNHHYMNRSRFEYGSVNDHIFRNSLKAYVYLITWFLQDNSRLKETKDNQQKSKKNIKNQQQKQTRNMNSSEKTQALNNEIQLHTIQSLGYLTEILDLDIKYLWAEQKVEEEFAKVFLKTGFDMLENPNNTKIPEIKDSLFDIMQKCISKFANEVKYMQTQNSTKIIDLLYSQDNLAPYMAEFVGIVSRDQGPQMPYVIISELTKSIFNNDSSHETIGIRNVGIFLKKLSKICPKIIYQNLNLLLGFFDCESYLLRQAIIKILANIIQLVLTNSDSIDQNTQMVYTQTKDKFLDLLLKRFYDKSSYCRAKVIKVFKRLTEANVVPRFKYFDLLKCVIGRLRDQTTNVRKNALKLFGQIIVIYGMIFNVDLKKGDKFLPLADIQREKNQIVHDSKEVQTKCEQIQKEEQRIKRKVIEQLNIQDEASAQIALQSNQEYMNIAKKLKDNFELFQQTEYIYKSLQEYEEFIKIVDDAVQFLTLLLSSKTQQDTIEAIKVFRLLYQFGIKSSLTGIKKMMTLIFSKDNSVQQAVYECYRVIYFDQSFPTQEKTKNLINLVSNASLTDITCIEELMKKCVQNDIFEREIYNTLWRYYTHPSKAQVTNKPHTLSAEQLHRLRIQSKEEQRASIQLLRMMGTQNIEIILSQKDNLFEYSQKFALFERPDFIILREGLMIYEKLIIFQMTNDTYQKKKSKRESVKQLEDRDKEYLFKLFGVIIKTFGTDDLEWFCASEQILNTLFNIKTRNSPDYAKYIIQALTTKLYSKDKHHQEAPIIEEDFKNSQNDDEPQITGANYQSLRNDITDLHYAQLFFVVGHVSIKMLTYVEQIESELKKCQTYSYGAQQEKGSSLNNQGDGDDNEDELDQIGGGKEGEIDQYALILHKITEESLIQNGMLGKFLPPIINIAKITLEKYQNPDPALVPQICVLERSAILALCKYMCISSQICQDNIDLLFQLLASKIDYGVKSNIIISIGDLFNRFPNILNEKTKDIFSLLHDKDTYVRRQALMVITHLILNDMLKLKGEIVDICMLLEDQDDRIRDQVKLFLHELHTKANHIIYNLFPKAISRLSKEFQDIKKEEFENIAKNLLSHIDKDKQTESIVERLCQKLKNSTNQIEWRNTAFCLSQLKYNEKIFVKLSDQYDDYKDRLNQNSEVKEYFQFIVVQAKKFPKPEMRKLVDDFEFKINADENTQQQIKSNQLLSGQNKGGQGKNKNKKKQQNQQQQNQEQDQQELQKEIDSFQPKGNNSKKRVRGTTDPKQGQINFPTTSGQNQKPAQGKNLMQQQVQTPQQISVKSGKNSAVQSGVQTPSKQQAIQPGHLVFQQQIQSMQNQHQQQQLQMKPGGLSAPQQPNSFSFNNATIQQQMQNPQMMQQMQLQQQQQMMMQQAAFQQQQLQQQQYYQQQQQMMTAMQYQNMTPQQLLHYQQMQMEQQQQLELEDDEYDVEECDSDN